MEPQTIRDPETGEKIKDGGEVIPDPLDLFSTIPTQTGIKQATTEIVPTKDALQDANRAITFKFSSDSKSLIDPKRIFVYIVSRIVQKNGANIPEHEAGEGEAINHRDESNVLFVNGLSHAWFKTVEVKINSDRVSTSGTDNYAFRGDLETRLGNTVEVKEGPLEFAGFIEEATAFDHIEAAHLQFDRAIRGNGPYNHPALIKRYKKSANSKEYETYGKIHADIFEQDKFLPPDTQIEITFTRNDSSFVLLSKTADINAKAVIDYMHVEYTRVEPEEEYLEALKAQIYSGKEACLYPIKRVHVEEYTVPPGQLNLGKIDLFPTEKYIPRRIFVVFVRATAVTLGDIGQDPFNYEDFKIRRVGLKVGSKHRPRPPYLCNFQDGRTLVPLKMLHDAINCDMENFNSGINLDNYKGRNCIFAFDILNTYTDSGECFERSEAERIDLEVQAQEAQGFGIRALVYGEFDAEIHIKPSKAVVMHENA